MENIDLLDKVYLPKVDQDNFRDSGPRRLGP